MTILTEDTGRIAGLQTLVFDKKTNQYFTVNSVSYPIVNKTFILKCDENGNSKDWNEVFVIMPSNHKKIVNMLADGTLTANDFNFMV